MSRSSQLASPIAAILANSAMHLDDQRRASILPRCMARGPPCASHRRGSNANSLCGRNSAGSPEKPFKGIFCADISEFESSHPSHAVRSPPAQKWHCTARSPHSGPPSAASSICRETTTLLRSTLILAAMLVASLTSASIAACAKHSEHEKSYTRAPMRARSIAPRIEFGAAGRSRSAAQICRSRWCGCSRSRSLRAPHPQR